MWITPQRQLFIGHEVKLMQILLFDGSNVIWKTRCSAATTDVTEFPMIALNWFEKEPVPLLTGLVVIHLLNVKLIVLRWIKCNSIIVFFFLTESRNSGGGCSPPPWNQLTQWRHRPRIFAGSFDYFGLNRWISVGFGSVSSAGRSLCCNQVQWKVPKRCIDE